MLRWPTPPAHEHPNLGAPRFDGRRRRTRRACSVWSGVARWIGLMFRTQLPGARRTGTLTLARLRRGACLRWIHVPGTVRAGNNVPAPRRSAGRRCRAQLFIHSTPDALPCLPRLLNSFMTDRPPRLVTSLELFNLLQHQSNWPSGGSPVCLDLRESGSSKQRIIRGSHRVELTSEGEVEVVGASDRSWMGRDICLIDAEPASGDHAIALALLRGGGCRELLLLSEPFSAFESAFPFMCAKQSSSKAAKRPLCPSCVLPGLLYLGDLTDAAALPRLREQLNIQHALTALAELPSSLKASVSESGVRHTWCDVRDVEEADIKAHFGTAFDIIEAARAAQTAVFVHCSRGVSRSASLCIAYLMRREGWSAQRAREHVAAARPIIQPNEGFWRCLLEFQKELSGERTGVYVPLPKPKPIDEGDFELPPSWSAPPSLGKDASLVVSKGGEELEVLPCPLMTADEC